MQPELPSRAKPGFTHDNVKNITADWYTPSSIFDAMGLRFDLDPCQPEQKIPWIPAEKHYHKAQDGLSQPWHGRVWLNPPYGKETAKWLQKMDTHRNGVALVFARTDCKWFHDYCAKADAINFLRGRIRFVDGLGLSAGNGAGAGSMLVAWGEANVQAISKLDGQLVTFGQKRAA